MNKFYQEIKKDKWDDKLRFCLNGNISEVNEFNKLEKEWLVKNIYWRESAIINLKKDKNKNCWFIRIKEEDDSWLGHKIAISDLLSITTRAEKIKALDKIWNSIKSISNTAYATIGKLNYIQLHLEHTIVMTILKFTDDWYYVEIPMWHTIAGPMGVFAASQSIEITRYFQCDGFRGLKKLLQSLSDSKNCLINWSIVP